MKTNILKYSELSELKKNYEGKKIVLVGGCFDLLHYGHFKFLQQAKKQGDILVVALESDEFIVSQKKRKPIHNQMQRAEILASLHMVNVVILLPLLESNQDYADLVTQVHPSVIAVTEGDSNLDYKKKHALLVNAEVRVVTSLLSDFSTTQIMNYENILRN